MTPINILGLLLLALSLYLRDWVSRPPTTPTPPELQLEVMQPLSVRLYFSNTQVDDFVTEDRTVQVEGKSPGKVAQATLNAWVRGPLKGKGLRAVPQGSAAPDVWVRGPHFYVNLPTSYTQFNFGISGERMVICSLTRSLLEKTGKDVLFLVGGQSSPTLLGHMDLRRPYTKADCTS
ncbi:GerMN domain-containing protein [Deinococcus irradiatisoli]|uniref:GerMN domain-containing protein n=1 Tax=Deinococcus irradiatisoli TaxID=2202254 RepID=UPI001FEAC5F2|nr:GerMN domain-containing protein [Deinococcus irradiatisoli]